MSIHLTGSGNPIIIRYGKMVLSDLDQIKENERDCRRRLRLQQVRQQSEEISNRLLKRAKKIAREKLNKLEKDPKSELRQMHDKKIMEIQEKYQEDLEDIGQAHASAALQPDVNAIIEKEGKKDRDMAIRRGRDAAQRMKEAKQKDSTEVAHQERLCKVREEENMRAAMIAKLPKSATILEDDNNSNTNFSVEGSSEEVVHERLTTNKSNKGLTKKSPKKTKKSNSKKHHKTLPGTSGLHKMASKKKAIDNDHIENIIDTIDEQLPRKTVPVISTTSTKADKVARYNPEEYTQDRSDKSSISSSSSSSANDDSSYFSNVTEQVICKKTTKTGVLTGSKVRLYDHDTRQRNVYNMPLGIVQRIDIGNEPSAIEAAQAMKNVEDKKTNIAENRKLSPQRRGQDAILRVKVRRDYKAFIKNLEHLAQEIKLIASQVYPIMEEDIHARLHQGSKYQEEHQKKMNRAAIHSAHSSSRLPSPQKKTRCMDAPDTASRRVDIHVSKSAFNDETDPSQETKVSIDASAESSQTFSDVNDQDGSTGKPYRIRTQMKKWIRVKDTSDTTSTSFASPPPVKPRSVLDALTNITPILEILDSSGAEELRRLRQDISPVSTPETPLPRTMRMPSNIPHRDKISRMLRYNSNNSRNDNSVILSSTQNDQPLSTDPSDSTPWEAAPPECQPASSQQPPVPSKVCTCKNPKCKLLHIRLDDIHEYALKNCLNMLQKYEDLQNLCTERIASLTDLIERVRIERKDIELSLISPSDETSLMLLLVLRRACNNVQSIRKLIESIHAIYSELSEILFSRAAK